MAVETALLWFWRLRAGQTVDPATTHEALQAGTPPAHLDDVPIDDILAALRRQYPGFDPHGESLEIDIPNEDMAIEPEWSRKHFLFTFFGDAFRQMDRVVELMTRFGLACYDAGAGQMYTVERPPPSFQGTPEEQTFFAALDKTLGAAAAAARAGSSDPKERLKQLKAFVDSGAAKAALEEELKRAQDKPKPKPKRKK